MPDIRLLKVLIVDDHFLSRQIVSDVMREMGVTRLTVVGDGHMARNALSESVEFREPFHVVFLDWDLPHLEGIEILKLFRPRPEFKSSAFVMLTSKSEHANVLSAVNAGAQGYLIKPVTKAAIGKKMKEMIDWIEKKRQENPTA